MKRPAYLWSMTRRGKVKFYIISTFLLFSLNSLAVPMNLVPGGFQSGQIFLPCDFDSNQQDCIIDTGSAKIFIKKDTFSLQYESVGEAQHGGASGTTFTCDLIEISNFNVGMKFTQVT